MNMSSDIGIYSRLLAYVIPYWGAFLLSMIGFLLYSLANVGFVQKEKPLPPVGAQPANPLQL